MKTVQAFHAHSLVDPDARTLYLHLLKHMLLLTKTVGNADSPTRTGSALLVAHVFCGPDQKRPIDFLTIRFRLFATSLKAA